MSTRELSTSQGTPLGLRVLGRPLAALEVRATPGITRMTAQLHGPQKILDKVRAELVADIWTITWPDEDPGSSGTMIQSDGDVFISNSGGAQTFYSGSGRSTVNFGSVSAGRRIVIDGVDMTDVVNQRRAEQGIEPCRAVITVPEGSELTATTRAGNIIVSGLMAAVEATTLSGDIIIEHQAGRLVARSTSGDVLACSVTRQLQILTVSGDVKVEDMRCNASLSSVNGDITAVATAGVSVQASTVSGDIRITSAGETPALVSASSVSGLVRTS
jgi:hypothetical protein